MKNVRSYAIVDFLKSKKYCTIPELREKFGVSNATIHRDIAALVQRGLAQKIRGGVAWGVQTPQAADGWSCRRERGRAARSGCARAWSCTSQRAPC